MKLLLWFLAAVLFWLAVETHAQPAAPDPDRVVAQLLRDLHYDGPPPDITWVDPARVIEACACRPPAFYRDNNVYLSRALDLTNVWARSLLLHELVHHIQRMANGPAADCHEWRRREIAAHAAQNAWLMEHGSGRRAIFTTVCQ
jgi:hypothetical protein